METSGQVFSLKWNNYLSHIMDAFELLRSEENLVDVTLSCEGYKIKAHKMLLSACSSYFKDLFKDNPCKHPIVVFRNVKFYDLRALIDFIYQGEVNVMQDQLSSFLATAKFLEVKGLADNNFNSAYDKSSNLESESFDDDNAADAVKEEEMDDDDEENLSDASQYAQSTYTNESSATPYQLSIIPIGKSTPEPSPEYYASAKNKRKMETEDEGGYHHHRHPHHQRRHYSVPNINKSMVAAAVAAAAAAKSSCAGGGANDLSGIAFKTKQSVEIFPVPAVKSIKSERVDDGYHAEHAAAVAAAAKDHPTRVDRLPECEIQTVNVDAKMKIKETAGAAEDLYTKTHMELNHLLSKSSLATTETDMPQDSLQGHWLSSLNNGGDGPSEAMSNEAGVTMSNRKSIDTNVDYSQQRHRYICNICGATYKHLRNLRAHCHLHYGKTRCNLCNKVLCNISYFKKHLQQQHGMLTTKKTDAKNVPSPSATLNSST